MLKMLLALSITFSLLLTGCTTKEYVFLDNKCPKIEVLAPVGNISGRVDDDGSIRGQQLMDLLNGASQLRKSENYYIEEVTKYNEIFATDK